MFDGFCSSGLVLVCACLDIHLGNAEKGPDSQSGKNRRLPTGALWTVCPWTACPCNVGFKKSHEHMFSFCIDVFPGQAIIYQLLAACLHRLCFLSQLLLSMSFWPVFLPPPSIIHLYFINCLSLYPIFIKIHKVFHR